MSKLSRQLVSLAKQGGGSFKTVADRMKIADRVASRLISLNIQIRDANNLKVRHIQQYIKSRREEGISLRTLQNEMSAIRGVLRVAGKTIMANPEHDALNNASLGISGANRDGTKVAIPENVFESVLSKVSETDRGVGLTLQLSRLLGLRTEEAVQSVKSLTTWRTAIINNSERVKVIFGTKGGRPRETTIIDRDKLLPVINSAIRFASENNGRLIDKPNLHSSIDRYRTVVREAGLVGKYAPHSLRYAYAQEALVFHQQRGLSEEEAQAMVSMDLGHGDGRGYYVNRVYSKVDQDE
ncbi:integrase domain-containing protein [Dickeya oryzae]|uniref:integrase domain-containing protein n=1 Tax=Dickeya TaxID=204037 RepID=UPI00039D8D16|nr:integrase domain-containing protein [Dickeya zeae]